MEKIELTANPGLIGIRDDETIPPQPIESPEERRKRLRREYYYKNREKLCEAERKRYAKMMENHQYLNRSKYSPIR